MTWGQMHTSSVRPGQLEIAWALWGPGYPAEAFDRLCCNWNGHREAHGKLEAELEACGSWVEHGQ